MNVQGFKNSKVVMSTQIGRLHVFNYGSGTPILINPPKAGRSHSIAQKLCDICVAHNKTTFAYELLPATQETKNTSIEDLVLDLHRCIEYINDPVDLVCLCQGTLPGTIYTAIHQQNVKRYCNFVGTIDSKTGCNNLIERYMEIPGIVEYHALRVAINGGIQKGVDQTNAMSMVDPVFVHMTRWFNLYNLKVSNDKKGLEKWGHNNSWLDSPEDIAGTWYLQDLEWLFRDNRLYNGTFPDMLGRKVDLNNITCDTYLFAGKNDRITGIDQVFNMGNKVSGRVFKKLFKNAGHTKAFTGKEELDYFAKVFLKED